MMKWYRGMNLSYATTSAIAKVSHRFHKQNFTLFKIPYELDTRRSKIAKLSNFLSIKSPASIVSKSARYSRDSSEDKKSIIDMAERTQLRMESLGYEIGEIFSNASEKLDEGLSQCQEDMQREMGEVEKAINNMIKEVKTGDESVAKCLSEYKADLEDVKAAFLASSKNCTEMAVKKLEKARRKKETSMKEASGFDTSIKTTLENCLRDRESFEACLDTEKLKMQKRLNDLMHLLNRIEKDVEEKALEISKQAVECHLKAQEKAIKGFRQILTDSSRCFSGRSKSLEDSSLLNQSEEGRTVFDVKKNKIQAEICIEDARRQAKMVVNMLRQDLISCNTYLIEITMSGRDTSTKAEILLEIQKVVVHLRDVSRGCTEAADLFPYIREEISNSETRLSALQETIRQKFSHIPNAVKKTSILEGCCKRAVKNAMKKLNNIEKMTENCISKSKH